MSDQFRDTCVNRQNIDRGTNDPVRLSFFDKDGTKIDDITRKEANCIAGLSTSQKFYFLDGDGNQRELNIEEVNNLEVTDLLPATPACPSNPQFCGPPKVQFFGGNGIGAMANAIVSPVSSSIIGFDFKSRGFNYINAPFAEIVDECGNGSGGSLLVQMQPYGTASNRIRSQTGIIETQPGTIPTNNSIQTNLTDGGNKGGLEVRNIIPRSPGNGYLTSYDGSLGGNGRVWKRPNEGYVRRADGTYYIIPSGTTPTNLQEGDTFFPPQPQVLPPIIPPINPTTSPDNVIPTLPQITPVPSGPTYPVVLEIEEIYIDDGGFGYRPGDTMTVVPDNGAVVEPVINDRGEIEDIKIINPGIGFIDLPEININSLTGFNAKLIPILKATPLSEIQDPTVLPPQTQLIAVVDCVGKIAPKREFDIIPR